MSLNVSTKKIGPVTLVEGNGEMDYHNFRSLKDSVETVLADGGRDLVLDLSGIAYLDSSALGSLLYNQKRVHERGGQMCIVPSEQLMDILNLTHLDSHFTIVESVESGQKKLEERHGAPVVPLRVKPQENNDT